MLDDVLSFEPARIAPERVLRRPDKKGWDAADALADGWTKDDIVALFRATVTEYQPAGVPAEPTEADTQIEVCEMPLEYEPKAAADSYAAVPLTAYEYDLVRSSNAHAAHPSDLAEALIDWPALDGVMPPAPEFYVDEQIPKGEVILLTGHGGLGKTTLAIQLQVAAAIGRPWLGWGIGEPLRSLALYCEDKGEVLHWRMHHAAQHYGAGFAEIGGRIGTLCGKGRNNLLWEPEGGCTEFYGRFSDLARRLKPHLIIFDPVADLFGGDENNRHEVTQFIRTVLEPLALDLNAAVILLAHPSKSGLGAGGDGTSGSTQWHNAVRSRLYLERLKPDEDGEDEGRLRLSNMKANYAASGGERSLRFKDGVFVVDGLDAACLNMVDSIARDNRDKLVDEIFLAGIREIDEQGQYLHPSRNSPYFAPRKLAKLPAVRDAAVGQAELQRAMDRLFNAGRIRLGDGLRANRSKREQIVVVEAAGPPI